MNPFPTTKDFSTPAVSVIIPCRNEREHIRACLDSVFAQQEPPGGFEVIVADGMSSDQTREVLDQIARNQPRLRVIDNPQRIVSTGLNAAIRAAAGKTIVRLDVHTQYAPDYIVRCVETLNQTGAANVGGPWIAEGKTHLQQAIAEAFASRYVVGGATSHQADFEGALDTVYLGCWKREIFEQVGYFDEELVRNQDDEHNRRIQLAGGIIWQSPKIRSCYRPRAALGHLFRQYMQYGYWKVRVIQKHRLPSSIRHLVPSLFVLAFCTSLILGLFSAWCLAGWMLISGLYAVYSLVVSASIAAQKGWGLLPVLPAVIACYHFGYGYGFLRGILNFLILRKGASKAFVQLTRPTVSK